MSKNSLTARIFFGDSHVDLIFDSFALFDSCRDIFIHLGIETFQDSCCGIAVAFHAEQEGATYRLRDPGGSLVVETLRLQELQQFLKSEVTLELIRRNPQFLWLHASGAVADDRAVLFTGVSGRGKSTLVTTLCGNGWKYLSDDILPLDPNSGCVLPFPTTAMRRIPHEAGEFLPPDRFDELKRTFVEMSAGSIFVGQVEVAAIILPEYDPGGNHELRKAEGFSAAAGLLEGCINFVDHDEKAIRAMCRLIETIPVYSLTWHDPSRAARTIVNAHKGNPVRN